MKKKLIICAAIAFGMSLPLKHTFATPTPHVASAPTTDIHPTEAKYDKVMEKYALGMKAAFAEKDDKKTIAMATNLLNGLVAELEKMRPELELWFKGMNEKEKEALEQRIGGKAYMKTIFEILLDPAIGTRIEKNPELKKALEDGSRKMDALKFNDEEPEEENID